MARWKAKVQKGWGFEPQAHGRHLYWALLASGATSSSNRGSTSDELSRGKCLEKQMRSFGWYEDNSTSLAFPLSLVASKETHNESDEWKTNHKRSFYLGPFKRSFQNGNQPKALAPQVLPNPSPPAAPIPAPAPPATPAPSAFSFWGSGPTEPPRTQPAQPAQPAPSFWGVGGGWMGGVGVLGFSGDFLGLWKETHFVIYVPRSLREPRGNVCEIAGSLEKICCNL